MIIRYPNLISANLLQIKNKYPDLEMAFQFLDKLTLELKKIASKKIEKESIIFIDYKSQERFFLDIEKTNLILNKVYYEFFLKLNCLDLINKIKAELIIFHNKWSDIFAKNLFIVMKSFFFKKKIKKIGHYFFYSAILNSSVTDFDSISEYNEYSLYVKTILPKFDYSSFIKHFEPYFLLSYDNLSFSFIKDTNDYCRFYTYFDLETYLKGKVYPNDNLMIRVDKTIQFLILICFLNTEYFFPKNIYSDNSYIHSRIGSEKKITQFEFENYKECLHFNNL